MSLAPLRVSMGNPVPDGGGPAPGRVLMTADSQGGVWTYALELAAALGRRGVEVVLATMGPPLDDHQRADADRIGIAVHESDERLEWKPGAWEDVDRTGEWLLALADEYDPDRMASAYLSLYGELAVDAADTGAFRAIREIAASTPS